MIDDPIARRREDLAAKFETHAEALMSVLRLVELGVVPRNPRVMRRQVFELNLIALFLEAGCPAPQPIVKA